MTEVRASLHKTPLHSVARSGSHRLQILHKFKHKKSPSDELTRRPSASSQDHRGLRPTTPIQLQHSNADADASLPRAAIVGDYLKLQEVILAHVRTYYTNEPSDGVATQAMIEHASTGVMLPWPQIRTLLVDSTSRLATLTLCIAWTILSRSLLLKLGISSSPGSTFLPPELVECFQSFSLGRGAVTLDNIIDTNAVNFALLSRWKQISATLLHPTYVGNAFSHFDSRTVNVERALKDLDPLLTTYARPGHQDLESRARVDDLRNVLRRGAKFAFTLFSQPSFWKFDWTSDRAIEHGKSASQQDPGQVASIELAGVPPALAVVALAPSEIVIWPRLLRVMDGEGRTLSEACEDYTFAEKAYLSDFFKKSWS